MNNEDRMQTRNEINSIIQQMRSIQRYFSHHHGVNDIWSNSKIFEVVQANTLGHFMIPGHSGSLDARDEFGNQFEYKHFKETSSNHSWTFNDYSDETINKLRNQVSKVYFAHINDLVFPPKLDWSFEISGQLIAEYLDLNTQNLKNARRMINLSAKQIEERIGAIPQSYNVSLPNGTYGPELVQIFDLITELEGLVGVSNILTSNKFWEVLVSLPLNHTVNSEQGGRAGAHDAFDETGGDYEYKVSKSKSWNFQDISDAVLDKYLNCEAIILAIVDKEQIQIKEIWTADPHEVTKRLREKLSEKANKYTKTGKEIRRLQVSLSAGDLAKVKAQKIY